MTKSQSLPNRFSYGAIESACLREVISLLRTLDYEPLRERGQVPAFYLQGLAVDQCDAEQETPSHDIPVILVVAPSEFAMLENSDTAGIHGIICAPFTTEHAVAQIALARSVHRRIGTQESKIRQLERNLTMRRDIENAVSALASIAGHSKEDSYRHLRNLAMKRRSSMGETAAWYLEQLRRPMVGDR